MPMDRFEGGKCQAAVQSDLFEWSAQADLKKSPNSQKALRGARAYQAGYSAEQQVVRAYERRGAELLHQRWRGKAGELDLIFRDEDQIIVAEVKASKTHEAALSQLRSRQVDRICKAAEEFVGTCQLGSLTPLRLDVALVDGTGQIEILENALTAV